MPYKPRTHTHSVSLSIYICLCPYISVDFLWMIELCSLSIIVSAIDKTNPRPLSPCQLPLGSLSLCFLLCLSQCQRVCVSEIACLILSLLLKMFFFSYVLLKLSSQRKNKWYIPREELQCLQLLCLQLKYN